ncbi:MAG: YraN family protein [Albidovulum sp.]
MTGSVAHHGGRVAEEQVEASYVAKGFRVLARRWRGEGGEVDLIVCDGAGLIFVEVKRADSHAVAAERLAVSQMARIYAAAGEFLATQPNGQDSEVRFDAALVDGQGRIRIIENAFGL